MKTLIYMIYFILSTPMVYSYQHILDSYSEFLTTLNNDIKTKKFDSQCNKKLSFQLDHIKAEVLNWNKQFSIPSNQEKINPHEIIERSFKARLKIHSYLGNFSVECKKLTQELFSQMRLAEDFLGTHFYQQIAIKEVNYEQVKPPVLEHDQYSPYHMNPKFSSFDFKDGDILITKGISPISSIITTLTDYHSPFSHIAFVHVDPKTGQAETIESYIGRGVKFYSMIDAMKNENARILVLRPKDQKLATQAAQYMRDRIQTAKGNGSYVPYDYSLDFANNERLSCEEVAYDSYLTASNGSFVIPEAPSLIKLNNTDLQARVGMKKGRMMMPADLEVDSRFEIVLDWTDYRIIRDSWRKDVMMQVVLEANDTGKYQFPETISSRLIPYLWKTRKISWLWPIVSKITGIPEDFTPDVPDLSLSTIASLNEVQVVFLNDLQKIDKDYFTKYGVWPSKQFLNKSMNELMQTAITE